MPKGRIPGKCNPPLNLNIRTRLEALCFYWTAKTVSSRMARAHIKASVETLRRWKRGIAGPPLRKRLMIVAVIEKLEAERKMTRRPFDKYPERYQRQIEAARAGTSKPKGKAGHIPGKKNKLETDLGRRLDAAMPRLGFKFEPETIQLAQGCTYKPDYRGMWWDCDDGDCTYDFPVYVEAKGAHRFVREGRVKFIFASIVRPKAIFIWIQRKRPTKTLLAQESVEFWRNGKKIDRPSWFANF